MKRSLSKGFGQKCPTRHLPTDCLRVNLSTHYRRRQKRAQHILQVLGGSRPKQTRTTPRRSRRHPRRAWHAGPRACYKTHDQALLEASKRLVEALIYHPSPLKRTENTSKRLEDLRGIVTNLQLGALVCRRRQCQKGGHQDRHQGW